MSGTTATCLPIITDVHGHHDGLVRVLTELEAQGIDQPPLLLGDLFWTGATDRSPRAVLDHVMSTPRFGVVRGNTEDYLVSGWLEAWSPTEEPLRAMKAAMLTFKASLSPAEMRFLEDMPHAHAFEFGGRRVLACHASPTSVEQGLTLDVPDDTWTQRWGTPDADLVLTGHLHRAFTHMVGAQLHVCVGAVGRHPGDDDGISDFALLNATASGLAVVHQRVGAATA